MCSYLDNKLNMSCLFFINPRVPLIENPKWSHFSEKNENIYYNYVLRKSRFPMWALLINWGCSGRSDLDGDQFLTRSSDFRVAGNFCPKSRPLQIFTSNVGILEFEVKCLIPFKLSLQVMTTMGYQIEIKLVRRSA